MQRRYWDFLAPVSNQDLLGAFAQVLPYGVYVGGGIEHVSGTSFQLNPVKYVMPHGLIVNEDAAIPLNISGLITQGISSTLTVVATNDNVGSVQNNAVNYEFLNGKLLSENLEQFDAIQKQFMILGWIYYIVENDVERHETESVSIIQDQRQVLEETRFTPIHEVVSQQTIDIPFNTIYDPVIPATPITQSWELVDGEPSLVLAGTSVDYRFNCFLSHDYKVIREIGLDLTLPHNTKVVIEPVLADDTLLDSDTFTITYSQLSDFTQRVHAKVLIPESVELNRVFVRIYVQGHGYIDASNVTPIDKRIKLHRLIVNYKRKT